MAQLLSNLPVGAKVKFGTYNGETLSWLLASTDGTMILEHIIDNKAFDATEPEWEYGSAHYGESNIRQWLNSDKQVWYAPSHEKDKPPYYDDDAGFLYYFSTNEKNALQTVTIKTKVLAGGGYATYTTDDKVFLPSVQDVSTKSYNFSESTLLPLFANSSYLIATAGGTAKWHWWLRTPSVSSATYILSVNKEGTIVEELPYQVGWGARPCVKLSSQIKVSDTTDTEGHYAIIYNTAPTQPSILNVPTIYGGKSNAISWSSANDPDGDALTYTLECSLNGGEYSQIYSGASTSYAHLVPFGTTSVAYRVKATDPSGESSAYTTSATKTVINNNAPVISGADANLGVKSSGFTGTYTITDANNNSVTVTESIDGVQIRSLVATLGQAITYGITDNTWLALSNGSHTLTIRATDGIDSTVRTYTFTKLVETLVIRNSTPWVSTTMPSRIMLVISRNIPSTATFKVEVCNNGYDTSPTWEDCTDAVKSGLVHVFENTKKSASNWGVLVRVTVARNGATGACYISAIGGNFE
jgi:hypothetical protein